MSLPIKIATSLKQLMDGDAIPQSQLKYPVIDTLVSEGLVIRKLQGRTKATLSVNNATGLAAYINNHFGINDLASYIAAYHKEDLTRGEAIEIASNSKVKGIRTFKGFLVNCYTTIAATLNGLPITIAPVNGTFTFVHDYEGFILPADVTVVGIENSENFRHIEKQKEHFKGIQPLFVSRYPQEQSRDLLKWLKGIPNSYLHFGDLDLAGINIYFSEYKKHLGDKAAFFIPQNIEQLLSSFGNRELYDKQFAHQPKAEDVNEENIRELINLFHLHKKVLEQEILMRR